MFKTKEKYDIILVTSPPLFVGITAYVLSKLKRIPFVFEIRDLWPLTPMYLNNYSKWHPMIIVMRRIEKFGYKKADKIISLLPNARKNS